jgi:hypothetical protein
MMSSVVGKIHDLGVEVEHIPGRCTSLCQPVDVVTTPVDSIGHKVCRNGRLLLPIDNDLDFAKTSNSVFT